MNFKVKNYLSRYINSISGGKIKFGWYDCGFQSTESPIVIGGAPRSGTTLMYAMMNTHKDLFIGIETGLFTANRNFKHISGRTELDERFIEQVYLESLCFPEFTEKLLKLLMKNNNKKRWGDKSPVNVTVIDQVYKYFPKAKFIHVIRDGRDSVCSIRKHPPSFGNIHKEVNPWEDCVDLWKTWIKIGLKWRNDPRYYEVKYEELVNNPEETLKDLFSWLDLPWNENLLEDSTKTKVSSHPDVSKPINRNALDRWKKDLPFDKRNLFKGEVNDILIQLGYVNSEHWITEENSNN